jgi:hypothetical protein
MSHLVIHQATDNPYKGLPRWLDEGIAVYNENTEQLVDDFAPIFDQAVERNQLMTLRSLASPFPADPLQANLAYGQSGAVLNSLLTLMALRRWRNCWLFCRGRLMMKPGNGFRVDTDGLDNVFRASLATPLPGTASDASVSAETDELQLKRMRAVADAETGKSYRRSAGESVQQPRFRLIQPRLNCSHPLPSRLHDTKGISLGLLLVWPGFFLLWSCCVLNVRRSYV